MKVSVCYDIDYVRMSLTVSADSVCPSVQYPLEAAINQEVKTVIRDGMSGYTCRYYADIRTTAFDPATLALMVVVQGLHNHGFDVDLVDKNCFQRL